MIIRVLFINIYTRAFLTKFFRIDATKPTSIIRATLAISHLLF